MKMRSNDKRILQTDSEELKTLQMNFPLRSRKGEKIRKIKKTNKKERSG